MGEQKKELAKTAVVQTTIAPLLHDLRLSQLEVEYGQGVSAKSLRHMLRFVEVFPDGRIVSALMRQLSWSRYVAFTYLQVSLRRWKNESPRMWASYGRESDG